MVENALSEGWLDGKSGRRRARETCVFLDIVAERMGFTSEMEACFTAASSDSSRMALCWSRFCTREE